MEAVTPAKVDLSTEIKGMQREQLNLQRRIEQQRLAVTGDASGRTMIELKQLEAIEKEFSIALNAKRTKLLQEFKKLKRKQQSRNSLTPTKEAKVSSRELNKSFSDLGRSEKELSELIHGNGKARGKWKSHHDDRKYKTTDLADLFSNEQSKHDLQEDFDISGDAATDLSRSLLEVEGVLSEEQKLHAVVRDFSVRSDVNKAGMQRGKKEKKEVTTLRGDKKMMFQMEDENVCLCPFDSDFSKAFFAVLDGHVDVNAAVAAKQLLPKEFLKHWGEEGKSSTDLKKVFEKTFIGVDGQLTPFEYEGCTATTACIWKVGEDRYVQVANVGDSSAFLCRNGEGVELTVDHKVTSPQEQRRLKEAGVEVHEGMTRLNGMAICRTLGDHFLKKDNLGLVCTPHISDPILITPDDSFLILASDGLWDILSGKRAVELVKDEKTAQDMARKLLSIALLSPKCHDNVTVVVVILNHTKEKEAD